MGSFRSSKLVRCQLFWAILKDLYYMLEDSRIFEQYWKLLFWIPNYLGHCLFSLLNKIKPPDYTLLLPSHEFRVFFDSISHFRSGNLDYQKSHFTLKFTFSTYWALPHIIF